MVRIVTPTIGYGTNAAEDLGTYCPPYFSSDNMWSDVNFDSDIPTMFSDMSKAKVQGSWQLLHIKL